MWNLIVDARKTSIQVSWPNSPPIKIYYQNSIPYTTYMLLFLILLLSGHQTEVSSLGLFSYSFGPKVRIMFLLGTFLSADLYCSTGLYLFGNLLGLHKGKLTVKVTSTASATTHCRVTAWLGNDNSIPGIILLQFMPTLQGKESHIIYNTRPARSSHA